MWPGETEGETAKWLQVIVRTLGRQEMRVWCQSYSPVGCGTLYLTLRLLCPGSLAAAPGWLLSHQHSEGWYGWPALPCWIWSSSFCPHPPSADTCSGYNPRDHGWCQQLVFNTLHRWDPSELAKQGYWWWPLGLVGEAGWFPWPLSMCSWPLMLTVPYLWEFSPRGLVGAP